MESLSLKHVHILFSVSACSHPFNGALDGGRDGAVAMFVVRYHSLGVVIDAHD